MKKRHLDTVNQPGTSEKTDFLSRLCPSHSCFFYNIQLLCNGHTLASKMTVRPILRVQALLDLIILCINHIFFPIKNVLQNVTEFKKKIVHAREKSEI